MIPKLRDYRWIVVNSSAGKDSQTMMDHVYQLARSAGVLDRVVVVHADLGRAEWPGTLDLAAKQAEHYGFRYEVVKREQGDLLTHVMVRGKWPSPSARYCTSDHKRGQIARLFTCLTDEAEWSGPVPILNCMGMRAEESPARAKLQSFSPDDRHSNRRRIVHAWLPIHEWSVDDVWKRIRLSGVPYHYAYDLGMPRLSCVFCFYAPRAALQLAGKHNRRALNDYVAIEKRVGHWFKRDLALSDLVAIVDTDEPLGDVSDWRT